MMRIKKPITFLLLLVATVALSTLSAQDYVKDVTIKKEQAAIRLAKDAPDNYALRISGPGDFISNSTVEVVEAITLTAFDKDGSAFADGQYTLEITPILTLSEEDRTILRKLSDARDMEALAAFRAERNLPEAMNSYVVYYSIKDGKFIAPLAEPKATETTAFDWPVLGKAMAQDDPALYASITRRHLYYGQAATGSAADLAADNTPMMEEAQVFATDLIVQGSACVGFDCVNSESFGSDTGRYKENNLRIHFNDTSNSANFPGNDWRITINDSSNGGANYFGVEDASAGRIPFRIEAGARANSLYVDDEGKVGIGTATPVVEAHIRDGDSPTLRLEQDGSNGWQPRTWDISGNETNFFIRDANNSSALPFRIRAGAPDNSIFVKGDGDIGLGTDSPSSALHVKSGDVYVEAGNMGINAAPSASFALNVVGTSNLTGPTAVTGDFTNIMTNGTGTSFFTSGFAQVLRMDATTGVVTFGDGNVTFGSNSNVGLGVTGPTRQLELSKDEAVKPNGGVWTAASDRRLKQNIKPFKDGLSKIMGINPVSYNYNDKSGYNTEKEHIGIIAQEVQTVAPYMVKALNPGKNDYLSYDGTALSFILVNAVKEQQALIDAQQTEIAALKAEVAEVNEMKAQVAALAKIVAELQADKAQGATETVETTEDK
ncbi:MAG: tail fiber domain-containing protein [Bacteroidota bacterium]